ncbi:TonB-dependent receptor [Henriciella pelagia]|uniref:TonB-dependent receptor n=1 Tax=Henriciella pelagia TaxID=1977912 RepID=UPI001301C443|nr:TonB-dependent receptor [Henriciella pelagia]
MKKNTMNFGVRPSRAVLIAALLGSAAPIAVGQDNAQQNDEDEARLSTVTVTAQKREENLQDVPIVITAFSEDTVEAPGAVDITGLNGLSPNVVLQTQGLVPNVPMVAIRGISHSDPDPNSDPKVSTIIDGVYVPFAAGTMLDLFDVERVELIKGPQGTLFGKNNLAGTLNVITSRPTDEAGGEVRLTLGENGLRQVRAKLNTGRFADDRLAAKIAMNVREYDGYSTNIITGSDLNTSDVTAFRGAVTFDPTDNIRSTLVVDTLKDDTVGPAGHVTDNGSAAYLLLPEEARNNVRVAAYNFDPFVETETTGVSWTTDWDHSFGTFTSVFGYRSLAYLNVGDFDGLTAPEPGLHVTRDFESDAYSAELRFASDTGTSFDYVAGVYASKDEFRQQNTVYPSPVVLSTSDLQQDSQSLAVFAQGDWQFAEQWILTLGGRYTEDEKDYFIDADVFVNGTFIPPSSFSDTLNASWSNFTPRAALQYSPNENVNLYGSVSTGYKGGGFNSRGTTAESVGPYDEETVTAYEIGMKSDLFNRTMRLNLAAFLNDYRDFQGSVTKAGAVRAENVTSNIADIQTAGFEVEWQWLPTDNLSLAANFSYLDAKFEEFCQDSDGAFTDGSPEPGQCAPAQEVLLNGNPTGLFSVPVDGTGLDLQNAPPYSGSILIDHVWPISLGEIKSHIDFRYTDKYNTWGRSNDPAYYRDSVILVNGHIALASLDERWEVKVYGRNLTDEEVISGSARAGTAPIIQYYQPPRELGVELSLRF